MKGDPLTTGCVSFDRILGGGIPVRSVNFLVGEPGTGKTLFALQVLFHLARQGKKGLYLSTLSEPSLKLVHYMQQFGFFEESLVERGVVFGDLGTVIRSNGAEATLDEINERVARESPEIVVVDSFKVVLEMLPDPAVARTFCYDLSVNLAARGAASLFVSEDDGTDKAGQPELAIADGVIRFGRRRSGSASVREVEILKLRGASYSSGAHSFEIAPKGLTFYPRVAGAEAPAVNVEGRVSSGAPGLDAMMGGGLRRGSQSVVRGGTGTGKTQLGLTLVLEGARRGERGIYVSLEETPDQLRTLAGQLGRDVRELEARGLVTLDHASPVELSPDRFFQRLLDLADRTSAQRAVLDSLTSLSAAVAPGRRARQLVCAVAEQLRRRGITSLLTADARWDQGFAVDNVIELEQVDVAGARERRIRVIKTRGSEHARDQRRLAIGPHGVDVAGTALE